MNYGTIIKKLREEQNKTQQEIASILGIARQTYNHYEIQDSIIPLKHLNNLANYYNVSIHLKTSSIILLLSIVSKNIPLTKLL